MKYQLTIGMALLALVGCSDESSQTRGEFLSGCVQSGAPKPICACMFEKLEEKYSPAELKAMTRNYVDPPEGLLQEVVQSAQACKDD